MRERAGFFQEFILVLIVSLKLNSRIYAKRGPTDEMLRLF